MKKSWILGIAAATVCAFSGVVAVGCGTETGGHEFTILAVKEQNVNDYNDMPVFKELNAVTGKDVYYKFNTSSQYANNTDPLGDRNVDAIYHAGFSNLDLSRYGKSKMIVAIDEHLDAMPNFKAILDSRSDIFEALKSPDGHIYSLPRIEEMGLKAYPNILFVNKKWIERLIDTGNLPSSVKLRKSDLKDGLDLTRDQFKAILQKFNELDMDGDGVANNEVPLAFVSDNWQGNESDFIASFGVPENKQHKTVVDGNITFTVENEKWFDAVCEMNAWFKEGLIRTSSYDQNQDYFLAQGQTGKYGSFYWWEKETVVPKDSYDDYIIVLPLKNTDGKRYVGVSNELEVEKGECVISSKCHDVGGLLSYFDKFFEPDYSAQLNYGSISSGAFKAEKENGKLIPNSDHGKQSADDFRMKNAPYGVIYLTDTVFETSVEMEPRAKLRRERLDAYIKPYSYKGASGIPNLNYTEQELRDLNTYEMSLGNNIKSQMTTWIRADTAPTKAQWQNFIKTNRASIDNIKQINQAAYDRYIDAIK